MNARPPKHAPTRFDQYYAIHETVMAQYRDQGFVVADSLEFINLKTRLFLAGQIACVGMLVIDVAKQLEWLESGDRGFPRVQTVMYSYHVSVRGSGPVFRYDNQHPELLYSGHADPHHKHAFDWPRVLEIDGSPFWVGAANWPTLGDIVREARGWHSANYSRLDRPEEAVDTNDLRSGLRL